jgi:hypothetical protein
MELFDPLDWLPLDSAASERATEVQREMAQTPKAIIAMERSTS